MFLVLKILVGFMNCGCSLETHLVAVNLLTSTIQKFIPMGPRAIFTVEQDATFSYLWATLSASGVASLLELVWL